MKCADCGKTIEGNAKATAETLAKYSLKNYGRMLCNDCGKREYEAAKAKEDKGVL